jgi:hypothetical protein
MKILFHFLFLSFAHSQSKTTEEGALNNAVVCHWKRHQIKISPLSLCLRLSEKMMDSGTNTRDNDKKAVHNNNKIKYATLKRQVITRKDKKEFSFRVSNLFCCCGGM